MHKPEQPTTAEHAWPSPQAEQAQSPDLPKPKSKRGGWRPGSGRPKNALKRIKEIAANDALTLHHALELRAAMILYALNGDATLLKHLDERIHGRIGNARPIIARLDGIAENLPEGFDPGAAMEQIRERLMGGDCEIEWTTVEAGRVRRLGMQTLERLAARGDKQSAAIIARGEGPDPMLTLPEKAQTMTAEQVRETMIARYLSTWPWFSREEIERMVDAVGRRQVKE